MFYLIMQAAVNLEFVSTQRTILYESKKEKDTETMKSEEEYSVMYDIPYQNKDNIDNHRKHYVDLYVPNNKNKHQKSRIENGSGAPHSSKQRSKPPLVLFVHGGGWRRGDKSAWKHFISSDINLLAFCFYLFHNLYSNVGIALASRGVACAVMSYPLVTLKTPWILLELFVSYICSFVFLSVILGFIYIILFTFISLLPTEIPSLVQYSDTLSSISPGLQWGNFLLYHAITTNIILLFIISYQRSHYNLTIHQLLFIWTLFGISFMTCPLLLCFSITLVLTQGILFYHNYSEDIRTPKDQMGDLVHCLQTVQNIGMHTGKFDHERVFLMGHSAGGHLTCMTSLDDLFLVSSGISKNCIKGVIIVSGVLHVANLNQGMLGPLYLYPSFGKNNENWKELCPLTALKTRRYGNLPAYLIVSADNDFHLKEDSVVFAKQLLSAGAHVDRIVVPGTGHLRIICDFNKCVGGINLADLCTRFISETSIKGTNS